MSQSQSSVEEQILNPLRNDLSFDGGPSDEFAPFEVL